MEPFGWSLALDLHGCDVGRLNDADHIRGFIVMLCDDVLQMHRFGEPFVAWFGTGSSKTEGYSVVQLIETSSVVGHFAAYSRTAHIDVFSCRSYDAMEVERASVEWFGASGAATTFLVRS
jgi:S-adenosylmethionine decarboxylase